ncbi:MAG: glycosyltransferase family 2 protein [Candidatus Omnitrophica bacterium]|nr:glycosyltransferase family 2 protein [Candidatus Omnitrophota bacterium]
MEKPLVSVLMTAYNREKYIAEAIESVLFQNYSNFELIIVDDFSKDNTVKIAKKYEAKDQRIKVYVNEHNLGQFPNRDKVASYAKGKYLKYLDSDDIMYPHCLEVMVSAMEKFPQAGVGFEDRFNQDDKSPFPILIRSQEAYKIHFLEGGLFFVGPSAQIILKKVFDEIDGFGKNTYFNSDTEFLLRIALKYPVVKFQPALIWWRRHEGQEYNKDKHEYWVSLERYHNFIISTLNSSSCLLNESERSFAIRSRRKLQTRHLIKLAIFKGKFVMASKIFISCGLNVLDLFLCLIPVRLFR